MTIKLQRPVKRKSGVSLSRQGNKWSKYRCLCLAMNASQCICSNLEKDSKRVYFKDLEARNLSGLFSMSSPDRIIAPLGKEFQWGMFQ